jgi:predicted secreted protein
VVRASPLLAELQQRKNQLTDLLATVAAQAELGRDTQAAQLYLAYARALDAINDRIADQYQRAAATPGGAHAAADQARQAQLVRDFQRQYHGKGPQYTLLCERAAAATRYIEAIEAAGTPITTSDWLRMHKVLLDIIGQLQQYTESTKLEVVVREREQAAMERVVVFMEARLGPRAPELWQETLRDLIAEVMDPDPALADPAVIEHDPQWHPEANGVS